MGASLILLIIVLKRWGPENMFVVNFRELFPDMASRKRVRKGSYKPYARSDQENSSRQKGLAFEKYITTLLPKHQGFQLVHWRSDKYNKGVYALSSKWPDLEYQYRQANAGFDFAIECKWRSAFYREQIQLCEEHQLKNYQQFSHNKLMPVYIALGVGGIPAKPAELYIIPLETLTTNHVNRHEISKFQKLTIHRPFYINQNSLCFS